MDSVSKKIRSLIMATIKSSGTQIERKLRSALWKNGIRYRTNNTKYFGHPDLLFKTKKIVIFIDSCFWHGCKKHLRMPSSNQKYWIGKISRNKIRDHEVNNFYRLIKWKVIRIWEHDLKKMDAVILKIKKL